MAEFIISGLGDEVSKVLSEQMDTFEKLGIKYIETRGINGLNVSELTTDQAKEAKAEMDKRGFRVSALSSPIGKSKITEPFEEKLELFKHVVEVAKIFEAKYIRIFSFFIPEGEKPEDYRKEVMKRIRTLLDIAIENDLTLLVENERGVYGDSPERLLDIFKTMGSPSILMILDGPNFIKAGYEPYPKAFNMLYDYIGYVHIKDSLKDKTIVPFGKGDTHALEYLKRLKNKNGSCFLTMEPHVHEIKGFEEYYEKRGMEKNRAAAFQLAYESFVEILKQL